MPARLPKLDPDDVRRLWFARQGLSRVRGEPLSRHAFVQHLERTGGLQLDSVNVVDRAHYLTLWSRFGTYDRARVDEWTYTDRVAFEHWGHEASVLAASRLPRSLRFMRRFEPRGNWWQERMPGPASIRRVLKRLRDEGPLESKDFEKRGETSGPWWDWKEDKRALELLWFSGRVAISRRTHFRRAYDLAERVYGDVRPASPREYEDGWLDDGLSGNGVARESHLVNYITSPRPRAADRARIVARALRAKTVRRVTVDGFDGEFLARPEDLDELGTHEEPRGTTLVSPFDSLLWQRDRATELLDFHYRVEIYVPPAKRRFGYYVLPILHDGRLVGRVDPKLYRDESRLELRSIHFEEGFRRSARFDHEFAACLRDFARFLGAESIELPKGWRKLAL